MIGRLMFIANFITVFQLYRSVKTTTTEIKSYIHKHYIQDKDVHQIDIVVSLDKSKCVTGYVVPVKYNI